MDNNYDNKMNRNIAGQSHKPVRLYLLFELPAKLFRSQNRCEYLVFHFAC